MQKADLCVKSSIIIIPDTADVFVEDLQNSLETFSTWLFESVSLFHRSSILNELAKPE